jgi:hypothetical protein
MSGFADADGPTPRVHGIFRSVMDAGPGVRVLLDLAMMKTSELSEARRENPIEWAF